MMHMRRDAEYKLQLECQAGKLDSVDSELSFQIGKQSNSVQAGGRMSRLLFLLFLVRGSVGQGGRCMVTQDHILQSESW